RRHDAGARLLHGRAPHDRAADPPDAAEAGESLDSARRGHVSALAPDVDVTTPEADDVELPDELPVLPLKETVVFPNSMTPLAIGQERSIKLVDDVVSGERLLALVTVRNPEAVVPD